MSGQSWFSDPAPTSGARPRPFVRVPEPTAEQLLYRVTVVVAHPGLSAAQKVDQVRVLVGGGR